MRKSKLLLLAILAGFFMIAISSCAKEEYLRPADRGMTTEVNDDDRGTTSDDRDYGGHGGGGCNGGG